jgi:threonine synthase
MSYFTGLRCRMCGTGFPAEALFVCDQCLGPLEVTYDYDAIGRAVTRDMVSARPENLWRYRELLPVDEPRTGFHSGFTPLVKAERLGRRLGLNALYIKDDSVNHPTFSYKDRVVSVAASRAVDLGFEVFACASTGNLANSVAAHAARLGLTCYVFIPDNLEAAKVMGSAVYRPHVVAVSGNYDDINRLCTQIADRHGWGFANINLRTYYAEGAKTYGFEIVEQLGWQYPRHVVCPVAGGTLLPRIGRAFEELRTLGWASGDLPVMHAVQAEGSAPVVRAFQAGAEFPDPVKPDTIAKSIAIGNPADGYHVLQTLRETGGTATMVNDEAILDALVLLAETEGIFTEPAGGATLAGAIALAKQGVLGPDEPVVVCITGNGYKTSDVLNGRIGEPVRLGKKLSDFEDYLAVGSQQ